MGDPASAKIDYDNPPFPLTPIDRELLAMKDEDFHKITWHDLQTIISNNSLEELKRIPSDLRRYLAWSHDIKQRYGGITNFVVKERLQWTPLSASGPPRFAHKSSTPFEEPEDYRVLKNDWPYGLAPGLVHLLVWTKTPIEVDNQQGDVTLYSRKLIEHFIDEYFVKPLGADGNQRVLWFKNWVSLQSVRGVDHVHVLVKDAPEELLVRWTTKID
ncbi:Hypothetical protein R9X50_00612400 [Acrodontium crateriforme]|uniref:N-acetylglucosamine-induced protein 1 n=1 Tax=Acrodontium crateriforme TaxID=150365 RepID=A0AAQ3M924_9PEZI|nr:Hypothetical protein R9X50_00612400 [Acrodontium crateriforme]